MFEKLRERLGILPISEEALSARVVEAKKVLDSANARLKHLQENFATISANGILPLDDEIQGLVLERGWAKRELGTLKWVMERREEQYQASR